MKNPQSTPHTKKTALFRPLFSICLLAPLGLQAAVIVEDFDSFPDGGSGWTGDWAEADGTFTTSSAAPLSGGGQYLTMSTSSTGQQSGIKRGISAVAASPYTATLDFRLDSSIGEFTSYNDRIQIGVNNTTGLGTNSNWGWLIGVVGGDNGTIASYNDGEWYFYNNASTTVNGGFTTANMHYTGIQLAAGVTYSFVIDVDPGAQTYDVVMNGSDSSSHTATGLNFRRQTDAGSTLTNFIVASANNDVTQTQTWSVDNISLVNVPEPTTGLLSILGLAMVCARRRRD